MSKSIRGRVAEQPWSLLEQRRRLRRLRMIVDLTAYLILYDESLSYRQARCLVTCARKAILELFPDYERKFEVLIEPHLDHIIRERWPFDSLAHSASELVN
ncbi:MAG: hypothetical protein ACYC60_09250 [Thermoanaerobaculia bacterium]